MIFIRFFCLMKFCMERLRILDALFLLTGLVLFVVCLTGAFCQKFSHELVSNGSKDPFSVSLFRLEKKSSSLLAFKKDCDT